MDTYNKKKKRESWKNFWDFLVICSLVNVGIGLGIENYILSACFGVLWFLSMVKHTNILFEEKSELQEEIHALRMRVKK